MPTKSISYYVTASKEQAEFFDNLEAYELLEWAAALSQQALDARNVELAKPLDLSVLKFPPGSIELSDIEVPY
jgi:hypothetical protein